MKIQIAIVILFAIGVSGCKKPRPQDIQQSTPPPVVVIQNPAPTVPQMTTVAPSQGDPAPAVSTPQTPGVPTVTLPKDDNAVPVHVIIPPPEQKGVKK